MTLNAQFCLVHIQVDIILYFYYFIKNIISKINKTTDDRHIGGTEVCEQNR